MPTTQLIGSVLLACLVTHGFGDTHYVSPSGGDVYPYDAPERAATVIQDAVNAAEYGDVVHLAPGGYRQRVKLKDGVRLWGSGPSSTSIIALEQGRDQAAVTGADAAEVGRIGFLREPSQLSTYPHAIDLGPYANQVVAQCAFRGPFELGIGFSGHATGPALIYDCTFEGPGGGIRTAQSAGIIVDSCRFSGTGIGAAGLVLLRRCTFTPGRVEVAEGDVTLDSCLFADPGDYGAGVGLQAGCSLRMVNCVMWAKGYSLGANIADNVEIYNSTFVNESTAIFCDPAVRMVLRNTILWGPPGQLEGSNPASFDVQYCDVGGGWEGEGNIDGDPMFLDPDKGDFRLRPDSPCIDSGADGGPAWLPGADFAGNPRTLYGGPEPTPDPPTVVERTSDMGAYEYYINRVSSGPLPGQATLTWSSMFSSTYSVSYSEDMVNWHLADGSVGPGWDEVLLSWTDDGSKTGVPPSLVPQRFYRVLENP